MNLFKIFNSQRTISVPREELAAMVAPLMLDRDNHSNEAIARGWEEAREWLRIGFDAEKDKGTLYHALFHALRTIGQTIRNTPENAPAFEIGAHHLAALRGTADQLAEAAFQLKLMGSQKRGYEPQIVKDRHGNELAVPFTQIYNRPGANHAKYAEKIEDVRGRIDAYFEKTPIRPATARQLTGYYPAPELFR